VPARRRWPPPRPVASELGSPTPAPTAGGPAISSTAQSAGTTDPAPPTPIPGAFPPASRPRSPASAGSASSAQHRSRRWSAGRPPPSTASLPPGPHRLALMDRPTGRVIGRYERATPASCSTSMSRNSAGCAPAVATASRPGVRPAPGPHRQIGQRPGDDVVHPAVDDHSRLASAEGPGRRARPELRGVPGPRRGAASPSSAC
jgi:hypothetical protein